MGMAYIVRRGGTGDGAVCKGAASASSKNYIISFSTEDMSALSNGSYLVRVDISTSSKKLHTDFVFVKSTDSHSGTVYTVKSGSSGTPVVESTDAWTTVSAVNYRSVTYNSSSVAFTLSNGSLSAPAVTGHAVRLYKM